MIAASGPCLVIHAYRAQRSLRRILCKIPDEFWAAGGRVVIVQDASPDRTGRMADTLTSQFPGLSVLHHDERKGYGASCKEGLTRALSLGCTACAVIPATGVSSVAPLMEYFAPLLRGELHLAGYPLQRRLAKRNAMFYSAHLLRSIPFWHLSNGLLFDVEMKILARLAGFSLVTKEIKELGVKRKGWSMPDQPCQRLYNLLVVLGKVFLGHYQRLLMRRPIKAE
jgi:hypothetical protein